MRRGQILIVCAFVLAFIVLRLIYEQPLIDTIVYCLTATSLIVFLNNLTKRINFLDVTAVSACIFYLLMPLISYSAFGKHNKMAALWHTFMTIKKEEYFYLALPATIALLLGLWLPSLVKIPLNDSQLVEKAKNYLKHKPITGVLLIFLGLSAVPLIQLVPETLRAVFYFLSQLTYVGVIYLLHSNVKLKGFAIAFIFSVMLTQTILTGMYGELVYWSVMGSILLLINKHSFKMIYKIGLLVVGLFFVFLIQSVKHEYREAVWSGEKRGNDPALFFSLLTERFRDPASIFDPDRIYKVVVRANQGFLVGRAMKYVPKHEPFAHGETIIKSFASAFVPRFLWPDKPKVGGKENICRFLGDCGHYNYSYNIGQLGEAYVNFGVNGAWIYMFFYGFMLSTLFNGIRFLSLKQPSLLLWTPLLFYPALIVETDLLTFINTFIKGAIFCFISFKVIRLLLNVRI